MADAFLEARAISKAYEGVQALKDVSLTIGQGEVHCLVGENGSGKSTLIKIIGGVVEPDAGEIVINGRPHPRLQAIDAIREGIQIIYQDLSLFPNVSVAENISLNQYVERRASLIDWREVRAIAARGLAEIEEQIDLDATVQDLSVAKRQIVAIARSLTQGARLIIMDEPTSAITRDDVDHLFTVIARLKKKGISTLFISHKLSEVFEIADVVTILRDGRKVGDYPAAELDDRKLTFLMTGRRLEHTPYRFPAGKRAGAPLLEVRGLSKKGQFADVSFSLWPGEILGLTGLIGSGRTELALALFGLNPPDAGRSSSRGSAARIRSPREAIRRGIGYLPEDRLTQGLFIGQSIGDNIVITILRKLLGALGLLDPLRRRRTEERWLGELAIKAPSARVRAWSLSGGNQQRVVLAKWLATGPKVFILDGPTIGIDIASKSEHPRDHPLPGPAGDRHHHDLRRDPRDPAQLQPRAGDARRQAGAGDRRRLHGRGGGDAGADQPETAERGEAGMRTTIFRRNEFYLLLVIVAFAAAITIVNPAFLTVENLFDLIRSTSGMAILAVGFFIVLLSGGTDISFPAVAIVAQYITVNAIIALDVDSLALAFAIACTIGVAFGAVNAFFISVFRIPTLIVTLGTMNVFHGLMLEFVGTKAINAGPAPRLLQELRAGRRSCACRGGTGPSTGCRCSS